MKRIFSAVLVVALCLGMAAVPVRNAVADDKPSGTIKFAVWDYNTSQYLIDLVAEYQNENPGAKIEVADISANDYIDKIAIILASGDKTDVITAKDMPGYALWFSQGRYLPLDDFIERDDFDMSVYGGLEKDLMLDEHVYAVPYRADCWVLYYNKEMFDAACVDYPGMDMTWDEYRELAAKMTTGEGADKVYGSYIHTWKSAGLNWSIVDGEHGTMSDGEYEKFLPFMELALAMQDEDKSVIDYATIKATSGSYRGYFYNQQIAMIPMGSWLVGDLLNVRGEDGGFDFDWGMTYVPHTEGAEAGATFGGVTPFMINRRAENAELAWDFIKWACTEPGAIITAAAGTMPAFKNEAVMEVYTGHELFPTDENSLLALSPPSNVIEFAPHVQGSAIDKIIQEEYELMMIGEQSPEKAVEAMEKRYVQELE